MTDRGRIRIEQGSKRVRVMLGGEIVADTTSPLLVWEVPYYPTYYFPAVESTSRAVKEYRSWKRYMVQ